MEDLAEKIGHLGLEYLGLYYSIYEAIVTDNNDPQMQGRIKVKIPALGRDDPLSHFAYPIAPFAGEDMGIFFPPEVGEGVWVVFHGGNPALPLYLGGWWKRNNVPPEARRPGSPVVRTIRTKKGHRIVFDDGGPSPGITLQTSKGVIIRLRDEDQKVEIIAPQEVKVQSSSAKVEAQMVDILSSMVNVNSPTVRINNGVKFAAAIGDQVPTPSGGVGTVTGPPSAGRPLIP